jgi:cytochrome c biogenesis protein CcmG, thiol:disulfide interchange protein DsbE
MLEYRLNWFMRNKRLARFIWLGAIISGLLGLFLFGLFSKPSGGRDLPLSSSKTKAVIPFELETNVSQFSQYSATINTETYSGQPLVINFWASWCEPCHAEAPALEAAWQQHQSEVQFIGINTLDHNEKAANQFVTDYNISFPVGMDKKNTVGIDYAIFSVPETFFFKRDGSLSHRQIGPITPQELQQRLEEILKE